MKLYTEEQVSKIIFKTKQWSNLSEDWLMASVTPIELPSDEEIKQAFESEHYNHDKGRYRKVKLDRIAGAKWMKEQILNQTK